MGETSMLQPQLDVVDHKGDTALIIGAREGHVGVVDALLAAGADHDIVNLEGKCAKDVAKTDEIRKSISKAEGRYEKLLHAITANASSGSGEIGGSSSGCGSATDHSAGLAAL